MLDRHVITLYTPPEVEVGDSTVFVAPVGTPFPSIDEGDPGPDWQLIHPVVPDYPPAS